MIGEKSIEFDNSKEKQKRDDFHKQMGKLMTSKIATEPPPKFVNYSTTITHKPGNIKKNLIVLEQYGFEETTQIQIDNVKQIKETTINHEKFFPYAGIALNVDYFKVCFYIV